ncbi:MAG TPA: aspartate carbamoyltransferase catalytic subunit [Dissulfurispiraceae bacterium]|nr:aspartate carbamoyltransferase catalytic subunit [Dissulfurispiraceae bacterium]
MHKDLVSIKDLSRDDIEGLLVTASSFKDVLRRDVKKVPALRGKTAVNLFFEPSTRTRTSFELAEKRLSTDVLNFSVTTSSVVKGETLYDTVKTIEAYGVDFIVIRHSSSGAPHFIAKNVTASVINAGDGINEHPTQALLDAFTIREKKGRVEGLTVAVVGDVLHSRVARSNIFCLTALGAKVRLVGPPTLIPAGLPEGITSYSDMKEGLRDAEVVMMLRVQMERQGRGYFPSTQEYFRYWGLTMEKLSHAASDVMVMHPGPMNRGIEISSAVADGPMSAVLDQVTNGLAVRMAVMYMLSGEKS